jgi:hypothetical protein
MPAANQKSADQIAGMDWLVRNALMRAIKAAGLKAR